MNLKLLTAAAVLTTAVAAPALAQDPVARSPSVKQHRGHVYHHGNGFWPGDVAASIVGGAIGTAGAIAAAPFGYDRYAYNDGYYGYRCVPGTTFIGPDGLRRLCR
ncbi:MAG: hypothetical protein HY852_02110 [Bradyrhizobium sp.]|uniref:hypothetical protein n=1 Tax=Bradyrhizobium sp. TaxID=376 RepID=UPI0025BBE3DB|nr:hypothetical protein [Bradyrhizobium sp.]MBI5260595.1 hypothetical protein [Bradyrhizobium sp.]